MSDTLKKQIEEDVQSNSIVIYMKGEPDAPMCGFSARAVEILKSLGKPFKAINIFNDPQIRPTLVAYSDWPTTPQVFIKGELVGGSDIVAELYEQGELQKMVEDI